MESWKLKNAGVACRVDLRAALPQPAGVTLEELKTTTSVSDLSLALQALLADRRGDWDHAHTLAQQAGNADGDWVHAYLHRKEGDIGNAGYWYRRADRPVVGAGVSLESEWDSIATELLGRKD